MDAKAGAFVRRQRLVTLAALAALAALAWLWIARGAGSGMPAHIRFAFFPHLDGGMPIHGQGSAPRLLLILSMWWVMMIAMMLPSAAPTVMLYQKASRLPHVASFVAGYLAVWLGFSLIATGLQVALGRAGLMTMTMTLAARLLSGAMLIGCGLYQFTPFKSACLHHCRNPAGFLARQHRPGAAGAFRLGWIHGAYCVGCCWLLMALLFVGGVMNLVWIAALTLLVTAEKWLPAGQWAARFAGILCLAWGATVLMAG